MTELHLFMAVWFIVTLGVAFAVGRAGLGDSLLFALVTLWPLVLFTALLAAPFAGMWWLGKRARKD